MNQRVRQKIEAALAAKTNATLSNINAAKSVADQVVSGEKVSHWSTLRQGAHGHNNRRKKVAREAGFPSALRSWTDHDYGKSLPLVHQRSRFQGLAELTSTVTGMFTTRSPNALAAACCSATQNLP